MTEILYSGNRDAPISNFFGNNQLNNYYAIRDRTESSTGFKFFVHDAEHSYQVLNQNRNGPWTSPNFETIESFNPQYLHQELMANEEYLIAFADSVQKNFFNDGLYTTENLTERWDAEVAKISSAIIAESARWGDAHSSQTNDPLLKSDWQQAVDNIRNSFLVNRGAIFLNQLRNTNPQLFPDVDAPGYLVDGIPQSSGEITAGSSLTLTAGSGTIYYTTDGTDPRLAGGGISSNATAYDASFNETTIVDLEEEWNYLDDGSNQGNAWRSSGFNDSSWASGDAQLGYNNGEVTEVGYGPDENNKFITTYFRKTFTATTGNYTTATLHVVRDDGAVVYLNGVEIARSNMPSGLVGYTTPAASVVSGTGETTPDEIILDLGLFNALLQNGNNTLAVEIHQRSGNSSDISFDAKLVVAEPATSSGPITLNTSTNVLARTLSNGEWSAVHDAIFAIPASQSDLRISEIHFNPADPTAAEITAGYTDNDDFEFLEFYNPSITGTINLDGMQLSNGVTFDFGNFDLLPGERAVVVEHVDAFMARYGNSATVLGQWSGALSNGGEKVTLIDSDAAEVMSVDYGDNDPWYIPTDGHGFSLVLDDPVNTPAAELGKYYRWRPSTEFGGTPGAASASTTGVVVNEVLAHTDAPQSDSIELFNPTGAAVNVGGWYLSDEGSDLLKYQIPLSTVISAGGYLVFDESDFNPNPASPGVNDFALNAALGDQVYLTRASGGTFLGLEDAVEFDATFNGESLGRLPNGTGRLTRLAANSLGSANGVAEVGPLVISEVHYHPEAPSAAALAIEPLLVDNDLEYIEIANPTSASIDLTNWRIRGEADYDFVAGTTLPAGEAIVVVPFAPAIDTSKLAAFKAHYGITTGVTIVGGLSASLSNSSGRIALQQPDAPDVLGAIPNVVVDEVVYDDLAPWPAADGSGQSLERDDLAANGNLASSWTSASPTPGAFESPFLLGDVNHDGVVDFLDISPFVSVLSAGAYLDEADINGDGEVDFLDISPFISLLSSP